MKTLEENTEVSKDKKHITITHEKMDELFCILDDIEFPFLKYYPTMEEIEIMKANVPKYYAFILWILSNPAGPETKEEKLAEKELNRIIMLHTKLKNKAEAY